MGLIAKLMLLFMVIIHYLVVIVNKGDTFFVGYIFVISLCLERTDLPWSDKKHVTFSSVSSDINQVV